MVAENTQLATRLTAVEKQLSGNVMKQQLDQKLDKSEFSNFVSLLTEETISPMQKEIDKSKKDIQCIEVSLNLTYSLTLRLCSPSWRTFRKPSNNSS